MYDLGHVLDERVPVFPGRYFKQTLVTTAHHANPGRGVGENEVNWITELVSGTMQLGTHLDALSHLQMGDRGYGGFTRGRARRHRRCHPARRRDGPADRDPGVAGRRARPRRRRGDRARSLRRDRPRARETPSCFTPDGAASGTSPTSICLASPAPVASSRSGWPSDRSRSPGVTPGATARSRPRIRHARSGSRRSSTSSTASSSSRTSTSRSSRPTASRRFALILTHPKLRGATGRVDISDRPRLTRSLTCTSTTT